MMRRQLVCGVPEECHASLCPSAERRAVEEAPTIAYRLGGDHLDDRRMPVGKVPQLFPLCRRHDPLASWPRCRVTLDQEEVDVIVTHRVVQQVPAWSHPELKRRRVRQARERVHRYYTAKPAASGIQCVVVANHPAPHDRTLAVGSDDEVGFDRAAIIETQRRMRAAVVDVDKTLAQVNAIHADGRGQDRLQLGAMNADVRCPETLSIRWPRVMSANESA